jgi:hypothetical protein
MNAPCPNLFQAGFRFNKEDENENRFVTTSMDENERIEYRCDMRRLSGQLEQTITHE